MAVKWSILLLATFLVAQAYSAPEINLNQLLAEEALKYPEALEEPDVDYQERTAVGSGPEEVIINQLLAEEALKYPGSLEDPQSRSGAAEVNINQLLAEEALKYPEALEEPDVVEPMSRAGACTIGTNNGDLAANQPVLLEAGKTTFVLPDTSGIINVANGKTIDMYCTGAFASPLSGKKISAKCDGGDVFEANGHKLSIKNIVCTGPVAHTTRKTSKSCYGGATVLEIGLSLEVGFITTIEVCHDLSKQVTYYSHYGLSPANVAFEKSVSRPTFITGGYYDGEDVNKLYTQVSQMETIAKILGPGSSKYFDLNKNVYLARGHLAAKADFIYAAEQLATFYFINAAPQWQTFNAGNWERVEDGVKKFAASRNANFDIYTGTWGVSTLANDSGVQKALYLKINSAGQGLIPVPKLYYRVVIDKASKLGIVLIGVNNIHATLDEIKKDYIICTDVSSKVNWISWDKTNIQKGYSYACEVNEFAKKIGQLPSLSVSGLLY